MPPLLCFPTGLLQHQLASSMSQKMIEKHRRWRENGSTPLAQVWSWPFTNEISFLLFRSEHMSEFGCRSFVLDGMLHAVPLWRCPAAAHAQPGVGMHHYLSFSLAAHVSRTLTWQKQE